MTLAIDTPHLRVYQGNCVEVMHEIPESSVDAIVTDPPYGIGFMGAKWDTFAPDNVAKLKHRRNRKTAPPPGYGLMNSGVPIEYDESIDGRHRAQAWAQAWAQEALRVVKPGGYMLCFGSPRAHHRITSGIEDAGWTIRDMLMWLFGEGYPKSLNISKAFDKKAGAVRKVVGTERMKRMASPKGQPGTGFAQRQEQITYEHTAAASDLARQWDGWGTALKPAWEPIILAQRPLDAATYAANVERHGTGVLNIAASRIGKGAGGSRDGEASADRNYRARGATTFSGRPGPRGGDARGRWPANLALDEEVAAMLDLQSGDPGHSVASADRNRHTYGAHAGNVPLTGYGDRGGASRFFYVGKASNSDRGGKYNDHPTVKPQALMRWLIGLVTPPGGVVLDPFAGSGSTLVAATALGFCSIGIEREAKWVSVIERRCAQLALEMG